MASEVSRRRACLPLKAISRISMLAADLEDRILEMDINPLIVLPEGEGVEAVDFLVRVR